MERELAVEIFGASMAINRELGNMDALVSEIPNSVEKQIYVKALGDLIGIVYSNIMLTLITEYPDLKPENLPPD